MRLRKRDRPVTPKTAPAALSAPEWGTLAEQIKEMQSRLALMHNDLKGAAANPKIEPVPELLQAVPEPPPAPTGNSERVPDVKREAYKEPLQAVPEPTPAPTGHSEWVLDVKRGDHHEILNVYARQVPAPTGNSEWFFNVKRGAYNQILNVHTRRVPVGGARPH